MYVCLCYGVSDSDIRRAAGEGAKSLADLSARTGCATNCGCCAELAEAVLTEARRGRPSALPLPLPLVAA
jgi:bacterioferritin-associated ferredoxin